VRARDKSCRKCVFGSHDAAAALQNRSKRIEGIVARDPAELPITSPIGMPVGRIRLIGNHGIVLLTANAWYAS
jgi:hypothetical protein